MVLCSPVDVDTHWTKAETNVCRIVPSIEVRIKRAFPWAWEELATELAQWVGPRIDHERTDERARTLAIIVDGTTLGVPERIVFDVPCEDLVGPNVYIRIMWDCLATRSADGYARQRALRRIIEWDDPWIAAFVLLLAADHVAEILEDLVSALAKLDPAVYSRLVLENRPLMRHLKAKAEAHWRMRHRERYPQRADHPGLVFLRRLESWALGGAERRSVALLEQR